MIDQAMVAPYDGTVPFTVSGRPPGTVQGRVRVGVTAAFVVVPFAGLGVAVWLVRGLGWTAKVRWPTPAHLDSRRRDGIR